MASSYTLVFVVITVASLLLFQSIKQKLALIVPVLAAFLFLLFFVASPAQNTTAIIALVITALITLMSSTDRYQFTAPKSNKDNSTQSDKMEMIAEIDLKNTENQQLKDKIKQVEIDLSAAEMAKMEFLATMSHEIRTPLNGIIPLLDILLDSELSDFQKDYLSTAHISAIQMQKLIDDLLDYSKVEAGKLTVETRGLKIQRILTAVNSSYQQAAMKKNISIAVEVHKNVSPLLRGDPTRLRQVLSNLLSNAIKFSSSGTIKLIAKKLKDYPNKEVIRFEIIDQGIGLDRETSDNIFLPFTQEDGSSTRKFGGTGLGLAISKKIVELMNGTIAVESVKGKGSNFYFDLPLLKSMGETSVGLSETSTYQAILVNTNPLLFNKISQKLKSEGISFQKALGISQAYEIYTSINKVSQLTKNILMFIDFETAGKQVRSLCHDLSNDDSMNNLYACILTENKNIAGIPHRDNIKLMSKDDSIAELLNKLEVLQASFEADQEQQQDQGEDDGSSNQDEQVAALIPEILLVEDNEVNLKVAEKLIQYIGYPFDYALNGQEALEKVKQNRYRMILMDCQMPVMDGYRCTSKIRDYETAAGLNRTPILAMTANAMMGDREKCLNAGMDDYMSKPLNRYILEKTLKKWDPLVQPGTGHEAIKSNQAKNAGEQPINTTDTSAVNESHVTNTQAEVTPTESEPLAPKPQIAINQKWLSTQSLKEIKEFMGTEIVQLLEMFEQETPSILKKMGVALKNDNFNEVKKMAHMLKSTSANIGANGLSFFSRKLELAADQSQKQQLIEIYQKIRRAFILTSKEISKYISSQKN
jgi:signal transduction histidine kinase/CheY-like chemotaxis protein/HPt (histidine-containing phosphotransfer) domain-containing protein